MKISNRDTFKLLVPIGLLRYVNSNKLTELTVTSDDQRERYGMHK